MLRKLLTATMACSVLTGCLLLCGAATGADPKVPTRAGYQYLEVQQPDGSYTPLYVKGMNLSVALPGKHPSEFPHDEKIYRGWLEQIAAMNCNVIRVYTILPPELYRALRAYNKANPEKPLWLLQGVWVEPPPEYNFLDQTFMDEVQMNIRRAVDLVHGKAQFDERPGWTGGKYDSDVSPWLLAWLIGREWEPDDIEGFHELRPDFTSYKGTLVSCPQGQPIECWFAQICDYCVALEQERYGEQHPVTFSSWPPTDPLSHTSESNLEDEGDVAGAIAEGRVDIFSNDAVNITSKHFIAEPGFKAGLYASYHVYPYWPDFLDNEPIYHESNDRFGPSTYIGYLRDLKGYYNDRPLLIAEYGLPNGPMPAHKHSQGFHHGGHTEAEVAELMPILTYDIRDAGCAGGVAFSWIDEWFKKVWLWAEMYDPFMDRRLWYSNYDPEKNYGMMAIHPGANGPTCTLSGADAEWTAEDARPGACVTSDPEAPVIESVSMKHDEGYLYVRIKLANFADWEFEDNGLFLGLDVLDEARGNSAWPGPLNLKSDCGLEEVITFASGTARLWQTESFRFWEPYRVAYSVEPQIAEVQPHVLEAEENRRAWFEPIVLTNRRRVGRDGRVYNPSNYAFNPLPRGSLIQGPEYNDNALWNVNPQTGTIEVRLSWLLLGFVGPHQMRVLQAKDDYTNGSEVSTGIAVGVVLSKASGSTLAVWPGQDSVTVLTSASGRYSWPEWGLDDIKYHTYLKPVYYSMQELLGKIDKEPPAFPTPTAPVSPLTMPELTIPPVAPPTTPEAAPPAAAETTPPAEPATGEAESVDTPAEDTGGSGTDLPVDIGGEPTPPAPPVEDEDK